VSNVAARPNRLFAEARGYLALLLLALYPLARCALAVLALAQWIGVAGALALVLVLAAGRATVLIQLAACIALVRVAHWPAWVAVIAVAPRLVLILPGLINTWLASRRHPRPPWSPSAMSEPRAVMRASDLPSA
jgi:hypothetical protein